MLITDEYLAQQKSLHENPDYGVASVHYAPMVSQILEKTGVRDLLDYGAGKGRLGQNLKVRHRVDVSHYDPAIPQWASPPEPADMVACIDVLEHIETDCLNDVLDDLQRVTRVVGFFSVHTGPAIKTLPDGRNAHLIQAPAEWWLPKIMQRFYLRGFQREKDGNFWVLVNAT